MILHPHLLKLDFNLIKVLYVLLNEPNTTKAAVVLNISQPAVSKSLTKLREYFDDELFVRSGNQLVPTPMANALSEEAPDLLKSIIATLITPLQLPPDEWAGDFFISGPIEVLDGIAAPIWEKLTQILPDIKIKPMFKGITSDYRAELISGKINLAFIYLGEHIGPDLVSEKVAEMGHAIMCREGHPLSKKATLMVDDLRDYDLVMAKSFHQGSEQLTDLMKIWGLESKLAGIFHSMGAAQEIIRTTDSYSLCIRNPAALIEGMISLPFEHTAQNKMDLYVVYPRYMRKNHNFQWLLGHLKEGIAERLAY